MRDDNGARYGAGAGAVAVVLFLAGTLIVGERPGADASGSELAAYLVAEQTRIQVGCVVFAALAPFFVWFLAAVASVAEAAGAGARRAGVVGYGCGLGFIVLFLADVTALGVGALRPENMVAAPELATALHDFEFLAMGMAALLVSGMLAAYAVLALRHRGPWPSWLGWLAAIAALAYPLRLGTLFTAEGPFAADGVLGLWVPVSALAAWTLIASVVLAVDVGRAGGPGERLI